MNKVIALLGLCALTFCAAGCPTGTTTTTTTPTPSPTTTPTPTPTAK